MADPNQTPQRGEWACPCAGCTKAVAWERKQLIELFTSMGGLEDVIEILESRSKKK